MEVYINIFSSVNGNLLSVIRDSDLSIFKVTSKLTDEAKHVKMVFYKLINFIVNVYTFWEIKFISPDNSLY